MDEYKEIMNELNIPLILSKPIANLHKIFIKYTSHPYYKYAFNLLKTLCDKTNYTNKKRLLHMAFTYLTLILYNCGNIPYITNFDLMILCCFNLSIKTIQNQNIVPCLNKLKNIYKEKFINYQKEEIVKVEIICLKLLNYKINILTPYECLYYLLYTQEKNKNKDMRKKIIEIAIKELEMKLINNIKENIWKKPLDLAKEIINDLNMKKNIKIPKLLKRKIVPMFRKINVNKKNLEKNKIEKLIYDNNNSFNNIQMSNTNNNDNDSNENSFIYIHNNQNSDVVISHRNKIKSNIYNKPISLVLSYPETNYSNYKKRKINKSIKRNLIQSSSNLINSFNNIDIELNSSVFNKTNCESSSPNGSDGISSFVKNNNSGINITRNSSSRSIFKKPCLKKNNLKTFFKTDKKKNSNDIISEVNLSKKNIFDYNYNSYRKISVGKNRNFSRTYYWG